MEYILIANKDKNDEVVTVERMDKEVEFQKKE